MRVGPATQTIEVVALTNALDRGLVPPSEIEQVREVIRMNQQMTIAGLLDPTAELWTAKLQQEVEALLRMRWDFKLGYVIDRWTGEFWQQIPGVIGKQCIKPGLCERMKGEYDMQRLSTPKDDKDAIEGRTRHPVLQKRDEQSKQVLSANEKKATEKVAAAVDSLSEKQVANFLAVEKARHTGEKLIHHGADLKFVERLEATERKNPAPPADMGTHCANPGMHPKLQKRKSGGRHISE